MRNRKRLTLMLAVLAVPILVLGMARAAVGAYINNGDGTVTDTSTGLMWQQSDDGQLKSWPIALSYCEALSLAGRPDWRLPNFRELQSILDNGRYAPALNPAFSIQGSNYWSGTTSPGNPTLAWSIDFGNNGHFSSDGKAFTNAVRCVRGGPSGLLGHLDITNPDGGEVLFTGQNYTITWDSQNVTGTIQIDLYKGGRTSQYFLRHIAAAAPNTGSYSFDPPNDVLTASDYLIRISAIGNVQDFSRAFFTITNRSTNATRSAPWNLLLLLNE